jgi:hypothetical protein
MAYRNLLSGLVSMAFLATTACSSESPVQHYSVVDVAIQTSAEESVRSWLPEPEAAGRWLDRGLRSSERGLSATEGPVKLRATLNYTAYVLPRPQGTTLRVDVDLQLEADVDNHGEVLLLVASRQQRHALASHRPKEDLLVPLSRTLLHQAISEVLEELRDQAEVHLSPGDELTAWITNEGIAPSARRLAMLRASGAIDANSEAALLVASAHEDHQIALTAAQALFEAGSARAPHVLMRIAQQLSRDRLYDEYLEVLPLLHSLDEPWIALYLETVAEAHRMPRVRKLARDLIADR